MMINRMIVYEEFTVKLVARSKEIKYGDPRDPNIVIGLLINGKQLEKSLDNIQKSRESGFDILLEGEHLGNFLTPTVICNVDNESELAQSELFSPIALITKASSDDAIEKANDTKYGLSSAIFSNNVDKVREYDLELDFCMIHINDQPVNDEPTALFGGMRQSGISRFSNLIIIDEFTEENGFPFRRKHGSIRFSRDVKWLLSIIINVSS